MNAGETAHQGGGIEPFELVKLTAVDDSRDHLSHVIRLLHVVRDNAVELLAVIAWRLGLRGIERHPLDEVGVCYRAACERECVMIVERVVIGDPGLPGVHIGPAEVLCAHHLARRRLYQRWTAEEDGALVAHNDRLVAHSRHVGTARGARPHHYRNLRNAGTGHVRLVVEDAAEMLAIGKDVVLQWQKRAARVNEVDAREIVLPSHLLCAQVLLNRDGVISASLHGCVIGDDNALAAFDAADAGDHAAGGHTAIVHAMAREL